MNPNFHISQFADKLKCKYCGKIHGTDKWPIDGDQVGFYYQKDPGKYTLPVHCPNCGKEWYVVWDQDPGPIKILTKASFEAAIKEIRNKKYGFPINKKWWEFWK